MKRYAILLVIFAVAAVGASASYSLADDDKRLEAFLGKLEKFYKNKDSQTTNWRMPNHNPETNMDHMPNVDIDFYDHETGLQYDPATGKVFDRKLNIELDVVTGVIYDYKTDKEYQLSELRNNPQQEQTSSDAP